MGQMTSCALCGSKKNFKILYQANFSLKKIDQNVFSARRLPDQLHYRVVKCQKCGLIRSHPILSSKKIAWLYRQGRIIYQAEVPYLKKTYGDYLLKVMPLVSQKNRLLEIGCGHGFFLQEAKALGFKNVYGVEPSQEALKKAPKKLQKYIRVDFFHQKLFPRNFFDLVCCFHVLDHVPEPNIFIKDVFQVLKPEGYIFFIVHNVDSLVARLWGEKCPIFDIEHIYLFNKITLGQIFKKHQFQAIEVFAIHNHYPLRYWLKMSPLPKELKWTFLGLLKKLRLSEIPFTLPAGNIGLVAKK